VSEAAKKDSARSRDSISNTFIVAIGISLVCSVLVSAAAVLLKPLQEKNETLYRQRIVLDVAGLYSPGANIEELFAGIDARLVDLASGDYTDAMDAREFDAVEASRDPDLSVAVPQESDVAGLRRRAIYAPVYLVKEADRVAQIILPVYGKGLWSTMYGYLALEPDGNTVIGLQFYEHAETPGLGDQVDKAPWRAQWEGKQLFDAAGDIRLQVIRGQVQPGDNAIHQVDGLSGATLTGRGVTNLLHYWVGPNGFGPYLAKLGNQALRND
jgi:Na+-transporting NADH:ubiquinone oxidoreductase subunit C